MREEAVKEVKGKEENERWESRRESRRHRGNNRRMKKRRICSSDERQSRVVER